MNCKKLIITSLIGIVISLLLVAQSNEQNDKFRIEILEDEARNIIDSDAEIKIVASGFTWTEGPLWIEDGEFLLFSDIPMNRIYKMDRNGDTSLYLHPSGATGYRNSKSASGSNGLLINENGKLVLLQHGDRRVAVMNTILSEPAPKFTTLVHDFEGRSLNSPNDGVYDGRGNLYFTDPPYGLAKGDEDPAKELNFNGVYCLLKSRELLLIDSLSRPNGITLSTDETKLYVAVSSKEKAVWYKYNLSSAGKISEKSIFFDVTNEVDKEGQKGLPDGMKMHSKGYLIATGPGGVWIFNKDAAVLARIYTGEATSNCALSSDEKTLFLTADDYIIRVNLK